jgi:hypothetical protein
MDPTSRAAGEYEALRDTIRERGTARVWIALLGLLGWAALVMATVALDSLPILTLVPLLLLAGAFEIVFSIHTGVERVGRYLQVFFEEGAPGWEHQAMEFGRRFPGRAPDPLFSGVFAAAVCLNFLPVTFTDAYPIEYISLGGLHLLVIGRILVARFRAGRQRAEDLERFRQLKEVRTP